MRDLTASSPGSEAYDVVLVNLTVHGGSYHKLIYFSRYLNNNGVKCRLLLNTSPPFGLQMGIDIDEQQKQELESLGVLVADFQEISRYLESTSAGLYIFDGAKTGKIRALIDLVRSRHHAKTGQIVSMYHEFIYHDSDYVFLQHPLSLWFIRDVYRWPGSHRLKRARSIFFSGNLYAEPVCNTWTSKIRSREDLCQKYRLALDKPICLWLPDREDGNRPVYRSVVNTVKSTGYNLAVKLHPWEYKNLRHGFDPRYGQGQTSADKYGCEAVSEHDSSWFFKYSDVVIIGTSTIGVEMPYWRKPFIYINEGSWRNRVVESCSVWLTEPDSVSSVFEGDGMPDFEERDYQKALEFLHPDRERDSFELHLLGIREALEDTAVQERLGSDRRINALYKHTVPDTWKEDASTLPKRVLDDLRQRPFIRKCHQLIRSAKQDA